MNQPKAIIQKLNELYVMTRRKYLVQFSDRYVTLDKTKSGKIVVFNDSMLSTHLKGEDITYGVFNGGYVNKFLAFDVDCTDATTSRWATLKLIDVLIESFNINRQDIHVSFSGSKGYHVDLFFDKPVPTDELHRFYTHVISEVGVIPNGQIEFRPSWSQGVKLPLGVHQKTRARCWFVDNETLEPLESYDYILDIKPMTPDVISEFALDLTVDQGAEFGEVAVATDITVNSADFSLGLQKAARILEAGKLTDSNTRHESTFTLARFFYSQGFDQGEAVEAIMRLLQATPKAFFSADSTPEYWRKEAIRLVDLVYERGYTFGNDNKPITLYKSEILPILQCGTFKTKQMLYAMLVMSKRYGNTFYFSIRSAMKAINTNSRETVQNSIKRLEKGGYIEYVRKAEVDKAKSREAGHAHYKPNLYRLLISEPIEGDSFIEVDASKSLKDVVYGLFDEKEIKDNVKRYEFDNRWRKQAN
ncbi:TOTE conflict system archaeo-eukaryotic primase domain-containing protein [Priestia megaterium]|uniref:TOTE conflict system archaeo-eukaryotic primase domain-containing protein n=1 Tax=Priestia megaterium TaxID=1404 RepID=UPI00389EE561